MRSEPIIYNAMRESPHEAASRMLRVGRHLAEMVSKRPGRRVLWPRVLIELHEAWEHADEYTQWRAACRAAGVIANEEGVLVWRD